MGVPSYFYWLINTYKKNLLRSEISITSALFLDLNCAIHPAVKQNPDWTIEEMYVAITEYMDSIIEFANPQELIYVGIDGVAPMAKMQQQRIRRYKSKMFGDKTKVDYNMISPGTEFMAQLSIYLHEYYKSIGVKFIISDSDSPGEGEHKIFEYLRQHPMPGKTIAIYGLDSDLIFLSILSPERIYLLREKMQYGKLTTSDSKYIYLDIEFLKTKLIALLKTPFCQDPKRLLLDYVFFSFLLGNDFLPCIPSLFIRDGGIQLLIDGYTIMSKRYNDYLITEDHDINYELYYIYLQLLQDKEEESINRYSITKQDRIRKYLKNPKVDEYIEHMAPDTIYNSIEVWQKRHNKHYFDTNNSEELAKIGRNYNTGMLWTLRYYTGKSFSWQWRFLYLAAPPISYLRCVGDLKATYDKGIYISPIIQLLYILPISSIKLIPEYLQGIMKDSGLYPPEESIKYCILNKKYLHEVLLYLPDLSIKKIRKAFSLYE